MKPTSVMIVEFNTDSCNALRHAFEDRGYITWSFPSPDIAVSIFSTIQPSVILLDLDVVGWEGLHMIDDCKKVCPHSSVIVESRASDLARIQEALHHGADAYLVKPHPIASLFEFLDQRMPAPPPIVIPFNQAAA